MNTFQDISLGLEDDLKDYNKEKKTRNKKKIKETKKKREI